MDLSEKGDWRSQRVVCDRIVDNLKICLNQGYQLPLNEIQEKNLLEHMVRIEGH